MKKHTFFLATVFFGAMSVAIPAQNGPPLHLVSDMTSGGAAQITLHVDAAVEVANWERDYLKVEILVTESNLSPAQLKPLGYTTVMRHGEPTDLLAGK